MIDGKGGAMKTRLLLLCLALAGCSLFTAPQLTPTQKYDKLQQGMTYQQFVDIMGKDGKVSNTAVTDDGTTLYTWENDDGTPSQPSSTRTE
jgi:hypothetical protein